MPDRIGLLFPGQGSQFVGMGKELYETFPSAKSIFDEASQLMGYSLPDLCFQGPEEKLTRTCFAQPAIFVMSIAALQVIKEKFPDLKPAFFAGLSLGEFSALVASKAISFHDGLNLVQRRAQAMEESAAQHPGTMASILGLSAELCAEAAKEAGCEVANLNSPDQIVLSGTQESIQKACVLAEAKGAKRAIVLKVGGAFHSSLMREAKEKLEEALRETPIHAVGAGLKPVPTFIPNVTGRKTEQPEEIRDLLAKQLMSPVQWIHTMEAAAQEGISLFLEVGPGKVLKGLAKKCQPQLTVEPCGSVADIEKLQTLFAQI